MPSTTCSGTRSSRSRLDGVEEVFDATVLGGHNFIANGIAVHNSIEQDADMVILLHRDEAYERESPSARVRPT
jgi:replicative DNA helicase